MVSVDYEGTLAPRIRAFRKFKWSSYVKHLGKSRSRFFVMVVSPARICAKRRLGCNGKSSNQRYSAGSRKRCWNEQYDGDPSVVGNASRR